MMTFDEYQATLPMPIGPKLDNPHFTGDVWLVPLVTGNDVQTQMVTFAPGCINDYHIHHGSEQTIICTGGRGWYQEEGKDAIEMKPGDAIAIPVEVRH